MHESFYVPDYNKPINPFKRELDELKKVNQLQWNNDSFQTIQLLINLLEKSTDRVAKLENELHKIKYKNH